VHAKCLVETSLNLYPFPGRTWRNHPPSGEALPPEYRVIMRKPPYEILEYVFAGCATFAENSG